jgi:hypothetical protein
MTRLPTTYALIFLAAASAIPAEPGPRALTVPGLGPFLDTYLRAQLLRDKIAGAVVVVVKDGAVLISRGYGFADIHEKTPMTEEALGNRTRDRPFTVIRYGPQCLKIWAT